MFKGISCGKIRLVTRVGVAVCSTRELHIHFFSLSQMQMYVKKYYGATFLHKSSVFVVKNDNTARFSYERELLAGGAFPDCEHKIWFLRNQFYEFFRCTVFLLE